MNEKLKTCLEGLSNAEAEEIWAWLDENPKAIEEMIEVVVDSHPDLKG